ncbi:MAG: DUF72 domain-containing protein [Actinomycetota bacterium]
MPVHIGTSGWQYKDWRARFYPQGVAQRAWLEFYAERFQTVESNNAFYMLPKLETFAGWARRTPEDFVMAVKMSRYLTHIKRLRESTEPVQRFLDHARSLGSKLGPVLLQLPPNLKADVPSLSETLDRLISSVHVAVEFRHESWFTDEVRSILEDRNVALCLADRWSQPVTPVWRTADWTYVRFHAGRATPEPCYGRTALKSWIERIASSWSSSEDVWAYFNNDHVACALRDARVFSAECGRAGLGPTRVPREPVRAG